MPTTEAELKALVEKAAEKLLGADVKGFQDTLLEIKAWGADEGRLTVAEEAVKQLEEQHKTLALDVQKKLDAYSRRAFDAAGRYRGRFASADEAREFALNVIRQTATQKAPELARRMTEVLKTDHAVFHSRIKDIGGDDGLIPVEHSTRVHRLVEDYGLFPRKAYRMPMSSDTLTFNRRVSGFRARKLGIRKKGSRSDMAVSPVNLSAEKFYILTSYPVELEQDALVAIAELLLDEMSLGFAIAFDEDGLVGDGTEDFDNEVGLATLLVELYGIGGGKGLIRATGSDAGHWAKFTKNNLLKLRGAARHVRPGQGAYYCSNEFFFDVMVPIITDAGGRTQMESNTGQIQLQFFGTPVEITPVMPREEAADQVAVLYGDIYQSSTMGARTSMNVKTSTDAFFTSDEVGVMATQRADIVHHDFGTAEEPGPVVGAITQ
ncbi:MAG: phage major capsid protein [Planctomycetota bacterium]